jgi:hypothetical protein
MQFLAAGDVRVERGRAGAEPVGDPAHGQPGEPGLGVAAALLVLARALPRHPRDPEDAEGFEVSGDGQAREARAGARAA